MSLPTELEATARALVAPGKGILAADESFPTIGKRFQAVGITPTEESRRDYRELLFSTPGLGEYISGAILFDETLHQRSRDGTATLPALLARQGIIPGIKVDKGTMDMPRFAEEKITQGLDGLRERLSAYHAAGARFSKWRAVITIGPERPNWACIEANARALALFAVLSQEAKLVPIVEPEVLMDGDHTLARCEEVMATTLRSVFDALNEHRVGLEGMLLKSSMVLSGKGAPQQAEQAEVAAATLRCLRRVVPPAVPGIVFLSGGQSEVEATKRLNAICSMGNAPWTLSFSFGRALQESALKAWGGLAANVSTAQDCLHHRAKCNALAIQGKFI